MYGFAVKPDISFYFKVPIEVSLKRILTGRTALKFHEAGMDLGISDDIHESFKIFQSRILNEYDRITEEFGMTVIDAILPIQKQQAAVRDIVKAKLKDYVPAPYLKKKGNVYVR
jgi:dTMP kinase